MTKRMLGLVLFAVLFALSTVTQGLSGVKSFDRAAGSHSLVNKDEDAALSLPKGKGAWLIELSRSGGMRPVTEVVRVNSVGEIGVISEQLGGDNPAADCAHKEKLAAREFLKIKAAVAAANPTAWQDRYSDPARPVCCDQPTTAVKLSRRDEQGREQSYSASWYPGSYDLVPTDLKAIATFIQPQWNALNGRCGK